jgi:hypothetical protein
MPRAVVIGASMIVSSLLLALVFNFYAARELHAPEPQSADPHSEIRGARKSGEAPVEPTRAERRGVGREEEG